MIKLPEKSTEQVVWYAMCGKLIKCFEHRRGRFRHLVTPRQNGIGPTGLQVDQHLWVSSQRSWSAL